MGAIADDLRKRFLSPGPTSGPAPTVSDPIGYLKSNLARVESGDRYDAIGPVTGKGNRAYGKYQVMDFNLPEWGKRYLGRPVSSDEFLRSPDLQEKLVTARLAERFQHWGNMEDVVSEWFTGRPRKVAGDTVKDVTGTTNAEYISKVLHTGKPPSTPIASALYERFAVPQREQSPFEKNLRDTTSRVVSSLAGAADRAIAQQGTNISDFVSGKLRVTPSDVIQGAKDTGVGVLKVGKAIAQGLAEGVIRIGKSGAEAVLPGYKEATRGQTDPVTPVLTGRENVETYQQIFPQVVDWAKGKEATDDEAFTLAGFATLGLIFADTPVGGPGKAAVNLSKESIETIAKTQSDDVIRDIIKTENPDIPDAVVEMITPGMRRAGNAAEVEDVIRVTNAAAAHGAKKAAEKSPETRYELEPEEQLEIAARRTTREDEIPGRVEEVEDRLADLEREARKYKSAEEFDRAIRGREKIDATQVRYLKEPETFYREASGSDIAKMVTGYDTSSRRYFSRDINLALGQKESATGLIVKMKDSGEIIPRGNGSVEISKFSPNRIESILVPEAKLNEKMKNSLAGKGFDVQNPTPVKDAGATRAGTKYVEVRNKNFIENPKDFYTQATKQELPKSSRKAPERLNTKLEERAREARTFEDFFNGTGITREALDATARSKGFADAEDFYTKTRKTPAPAPKRPRTVREATRDLVRTETPSTAPRPVYEPSVNLVKEISGETDPYFIMQALTREFPGMPTKIRDTFATRLSKIKRGSDIQGLLRTAATLDPSSPYSAAGKRALATIPARKAGLMSDAEKIAYIKNITRKIDDKADETAVIAQQEYDRIMEAADQKVIDRFNSLKTEAEFLGDVVRADEMGSELWRKFYKGRRGVDPNDPTTSLEDLMEQAQKRKREVTDYKRYGGKGSGILKPRPLSKVEERAVSLDTYIEELGFKDFDEAQSALERFVEMRNRLLEIEAEIKDLRPIVRSAEVIREMLDDVPVVQTPGAVKVIDELTNTADVFSTYKDIGSLKIGGRDLYRNFKRFFGPRYGEIKKAMLDPFDKSKGEFVDEINAGGDRLAENVVEKYGVKRGSKESEWIQRVYDTDLPEGERRSFEQMVEEFGKERAEQLREVDAFFRQEYNKLLDRVNEAREKMYPNNPSKLVSKQSNYYRHFTDMDGSFGDALRAFFDSPAGIDPKLVGISEFTEPKSRFLPFQQKRLGQKTEMDAVGGFIDYLPMFSYAVHIDPHISGFRYLRRRLADFAPERDWKIPGLDPMGELSSEISKKLDLERYTGIDNMLTFLNHFANDLAGKTNPMDRLLQERIPGGRNTIRLVDAANSRIKANQILGNAGTGVAQLANVPLGVASAGPLNFSKGVGRTLGGILDPNTMTRRSDFLKERFMDSLKDRFPVDFGRHPVKRSVEEGRKVLGWMLRTLDRVGTTAIWNGHLEKYMAQNMTKKGGQEIWKQGTSLEDAIKFADDETRALVGGRGVGEVPLDQKSKLGQIIWPFTLEVENFWSVMDDWTREYYKGAGNRNMTAVATLLLANYAFNEFSEQTRGSRVVYDPINALLDGIQIGAEELEDGDPGAAALKFLGRQAGEFLSNKAIGAPVATTLVPEDMRDDLFGEQDPTRFGEGPLLAQTLGKVIESAWAAVTGNGKDAIDNMGAVVKNLLMVIPPYAGKQIQKTYGGVQAMVQGYAETGAGDPAFDVESTVGNWIKATLFGQNATDEARKYFDERDDLFRVLDKQEEMQDELGYEAEKKWAELKDLAEEQGQDAAAAEFGRIQQSNPLLAKELTQTWKDEQMGLDSNDRLIRRMNVTNGVRAKYLYEQFQSLETQEEKAALWEELVKKKLITKEVAQQFQFLQAMETQ